MRSSLPRNNTMSKSARWKLECNRNDDALIVAVASTDRFGGAIRFKDAMRAAAEDAPARVILDLGDVTFVDSSGLGAIVAVMKFLAPDRSSNWRGSPRTWKRCFA